ncbi:hypothetical protein HanHA300_Chr15g0563791 [Helianthus annuus]|nr:hypothetical protein HanHA300_Chr15g0563791 [Helianthus annuus]KAJ0472965.1 hypothetical protein HanHA89_Chr15g0612991 [Helianthus annuus]
MDLVSQEPILFATIKENILFGKEGATSDEVIKAAKNLTLRVYGAPFGDPFGDMKHRSAKHRH